MLVFARSICLLAKVIFPDCNVLATLENLAQTKLVEAITSGLACVWKTKD